MQLQTQDVLRNAASIVHAQEFLKESTPEQIKMQSCPVFLEWKLTFGINFILFLLKNIVKNNIRLWAILGRF